MLEDVFRRDRGPDHVAFGQRLVVAELRAAGRARCRIDLRLLRLMLFLGALWTCESSTNFDWLQKLSTTPLQLADENVPWASATIRFTRYVFRRGFNSRSSATSTQN